MRGATLAGPLLKDPEFGRARGLPSPLDEDKLAELEESFLSEEEFSFERGKGFFFVFGLESEYVLLELSPFLDLFPLKKEVDVLIIRRGY